MKETKDRIKKERQVRDELRLIDAVIGDEDAEIAREAIVIPTFNQEWERFKNAMFQAAGGAETFDECQIEELKCAFYTGVIAYIGALDTIYAKYPDDQEKGTECAQQLIHEIATTYEAEALREEEELIQDGLIDRAVLRKQTVQ